MIKKKIESINGERFTPFSIAKKLKAKVLLESASFHQGKDRWSVLLVKKAFELYEDKNGIFLDVDGKTKKLEEKNILKVLEYYANQHTNTEYDFPIPSGGVGYLSYEYASKFDKVKIDINKKDSIEIKKSSFLFGNLFLIFDHYTDIIYFVGLNYLEKKCDLSKLIEKTKAKIEDFDFNFMINPKKKYKTIRIKKTNEKKRFLENVEKLRKEIKAGNIIQAVLSRRVAYKTNLPALEAYRKLRSINPSPYLFYLDFEDFQIFGSSPEVHVKIKDNKAIMRPIAGTRSRGENTTIDENLKKELLSDKKELAEHLMLVDLVRNDLGRVCKSNSVNVTEFQKIEKYSHVMHIVSQVEGKLKQNSNGFELIKATFPAGTVSGAPKISAMQIVDKLEEEKRGFYAGIVGWIEPQGKINTCITIRSAVKKGDNLFLQAGAGIVYDSVGEHEYKETQKKLGALLRAIGVKDVSDN